MLFISCLTNTVMIGTEANILCVPELYPTFMATKIQINLIHNICLVEIQTGSLENPKY